MSEVDEVRRTLLFPERNPLSGELDSCEERGKTVSEYVLPPTID
jgi:hypothetical protein